MSRYLEFITFAASAFVSGEINKKDEHGNTVMHYSATKSDVDWVKFFLRAGASPNIKNRQGNTPLHVAAILNLGQSFLPVLTELVAASDNIDEKNSLGNTAFHLVLVKNPDVPVVKLFLDAGASVLSTDEAGRSSLILVALKGNPVLLRLLLEKVDNDNVGIAYRKLILNAARHSQNSECIQVAEQFLNELQF